MSRSRKASWGLPSPNFLFRLAHPQPVWGKRQLGRSLSVRDLAVNRSLVRCGRASRTYQSLRLFRYSIIPCSRLSESFSSAKPPLSVPVRRVSIMDSLRSLLTDSRHARWLAPCLVFGDAVLCAGIITRIACSYPRSLCWTWMFGRKGQSTDTFLF